MKLSGTYRLISSSRRVLETGEEVSAFGKNAKGSIIYGDDGRFLVLIVNDGRPKPESIEALTDQQRADLHRTMSAYGGTYLFDGKTVSHHVELAWVGWEACVDVAHLVDERIGRVGGTAAADGGDDDHGAETGLFGGDHLGRGQTAVFVTVDGGSAEFLDDDTTHVPPSRSKNSLSWAMLLSTWSPSIRHWTEL